MKKILRRVTAQLTFELPLVYEQIEQHFLSIQQNGQERYSNWTVQATVRKVVFHYWYSSVLTHFILLFSLACLASFPMGILRGYTAFLFPPYPLIGLISFGIMYLTHYRPFFLAEFLTKLEIIAATYEGRHRAQLEKCKQAQYSNLTLVLLFYVWNKSSDLNTLDSSDHVSKLLTKVYGVDNGSLKKNLELILHRHTPLSSRKLKEVEKGFEEAYSFFESLGYEKGIAILKGLEFKIKNK